MQIVSIGDNLHEMLNPFFSGKNKKNISKCRLLKILPRVLRGNLPIIDYICTSDLLYTVIILNIRTGTAGVKTSLYRIVCVVSDCVCAQAYLNHGCSHAVLLVWLSLEEGGCV